jgi:tRNA threonylcarbamoyladenosine biosynthesis protein TsaB
MIILAVDTSGLGCSVALTDNTQLIADVNLRNNETHSKHLMGVIQDVLRISGVEMEAIGLFAVVHGPGSFTGLRIGMSAIKGLSMATGKPVVGVSSLDALAYSVHYPDCRLCAMIDARKDEVFTASYILENGTLKKTSEENLIGHGLLSVDMHDPTVFFGSGAVRYRDIIIHRMGANAIFAPESFHHVYAENVAILGYASFNNQKSENWSGIAPCYIRKSDAEINKSIQNA